MSQETQIRVEKSIAATREDLFKAWTNADSMRRWFAPAGVDVAAATVTPIVGGDLRITMRQGDVVETAIGTFREVVPFKKIHFTWAQKGNTAVPVTDVHVQLEDTPDGGTHVVLIQAGLAADAPREIYTRAWSGILDNLHR